MKTKGRLIAPLGLILGMALLISRPVEMEATEGGVYNDGGMVSEQRDRWQGDVTFGSAAFESKQYSVAIRFFTAALDRSLTSEISAYIHRLRGDAFLKNGERDKAVADYALAVKFIPKNSAGYLARGEVYKKMGNYKAAASDYSRGLDLSPDDAAGLNSIAWLRATCPDASLRDGRSAIRDATRACELARWKDSSLIDTLAAGYAEAANFDQAMKFERQAIQMRSTSADDRLEMQERLALYQKHKPYRERSTH